MICIKEVSYQYKQGQEALENINLEIPKGQFVSIIGKNGSGKSTLARIIAGITKPTKGSVTVDEIDTAKKENFLSVRKRIGIVFQNPENQILFGKVKEDIAFALKNLELDKEEERIDRALTQVGMQEFKQRDTDALSLGQKQRITIAGVLAMDTPYIVFDEPTTMLDPIGKEDIYQILVELKQQGYTILYVTNAVDEILISDRIIVMEKGKIVDDFAKEEILQHVEKIEQSGMKIPSLVHTLVELEKNGMKIQPKQWTKEELIQEIVKVGKHETGC